MSRLEWRDVNRKYTYRPGKLDREPGDEFWLQVKSTRCWSDTQWLYKRRRRHGQRRRRRRRRRRRNGRCLGVTEAHQDSWITR